MAKNNLYNSLIEIGLEDFLKERGGRNIIEEKWTVNLNFFVSNLTDIQKGVLKNKIEKKKSETHSQHNDMFHEISIACAFYNNITFLEEDNAISTPDFRADNTNVEVKTINNSNVEKDRQRELSKGPRCEVFKIDEDLTENFISLSTQAIIKKFTDHVEKAQKQLGADGGHIWVVYAADSPPNFHEDEKLQLEIENNFDEIIKKLPNKNGLCIRYIHFGDLRDKIEIR